MDIYTAVVKLWIVFLCCVSSLVISQSVDHFHTGWREGFNSEHDMELSGKENNDINAENNKGNILNKESAASNNAYQQYESNLQQQRKTGNKFSEEKGAATHPLQTIELNERSGHRRVKLGQGESDSKNDGVRETVNREQGGRSKDKTPSRGYIKDEPGGFVNERNKREAFRKTARALNDRNPRGQGKFGTIRLSRRLDTYTPSMRFSGEINLHNKRDQSEVNAPGRSNENTLGTERTSGDIRLYPRFASDRKNPGNYQTSTNDVKKPQDGMWEDGEELARLGARSNQRQTESPNRYVNPFQTATNEPLLSSHQADTALNGETIKRKRPLGPERNRPKLAVRRKEGQDSFGYLSGNYLESVPSPGSLRANRHFQESYRPGNNFEIQHTATSSNQPMSKHDRAYLSSVTTNNDVDYTSQPSFRATSSEKLDIVDSDSVFSVTQTSTSSQITNGKKIRKLSSSYLESQSVHQQDTKNEKDRNNLDQDSTILNSESMISIPAHSKQRTDPGKSIDTLDLHGSKQNVKYAELLKRLGGHKHLVARSKRHEPALQNTKDKMESYSTNVDATGFVKGVTARFNSLVRSGMNEPLARGQIDQKPMSKRDDYFGTSTAKSGQKQAGYSTRTSAVPDSSAAVSASQISVPIQSSFEKPSEFYYVSVDQDGYSILSEGGAEDLDKEVEEHDNYVIGWSEEEKERDVQQSVDQDGYSILSEGGAEDLDKEVEEHDNYVRGVSEEEKERDVQQSQEEEETSTGSVELSDFRVDKKLKFQNDISGENLKEGSNAFATRKAEEIVVAVKEGRRERQVDLSGNQEGVTEILHEIGPGGLGDVSEMATDNTRVGSYPTQNREREIYHSNRLEDMEAAKDKIENDIRELPNDFEKVSSDTEIALKLDAKIHPETTLAESKAKIKTDQKRDSNEEVLIENGAKIDERKISNENREESGTMGDVGRSAKRPKDYAALHMNKTYFKNPRAKTRIVYAPLSTSSTRSTSHGRFLRGEGQRRSSGADKQVYDRHSNNEAKGKGGDTEGFKGEMATRQNEAEEGMGQDSREGRRRTDFEEGEKEKLVTIEKIDEKISGSRREKKDLKEAEERRLETDKDFAGVSQREDNVKNFEKIDKDFEEGGTNSLKEEKAETEKDHEANREDLDDFTSIEEMTINTEEEDKKIDKEGYVDNKEAEYIEDHFEVFQDLSNDMPYKHIDIGIFTTPGFGQRKLTEKRVDEYKFESDVERFRLVHVPIETERNRHENDLNQIIRIRGGARVSNTGENGYKNPGYYVNGDTLNEVQKIDKSEFFKSSSADTVYHESLENEDVEDLDMSQPSKLHIRQKRSPQSSENPNLEPPASAATPSVDVMELTSFEPSSVLQPPVGTSLYDSHTNKSNALDNLYKTGTTPDTSNNRHKRPSPDKYALSTETPQASTATKVSEKTLYTADDIEKPIVKIGVILTYIQGYPFVVNKTQPAIELAAEKVTAPNGSLPGYEVQIVYRDSRCSTTFGPLEGIDLYVNKLAHVFMGPSYDYAIASLGRMTYYWGIPILTAGGLVNAFNDKNQYKLLTRVQGGYMHFTKFFIVLANVYNWTTFGLVFHNPHKDGQGDMSACYHVLEAMYMTIEKKFNKKPWYSSFDENEATNATFKKALNELRPYCRKSLKLGNVCLDQKVSLQYANRNTCYECPRNRCIQSEYVRLSYCDCLVIHPGVVLLCASPDTVRKIMIKAHELNFDNGEYVFFNIDLFSSKNASETPWYRPDDTDERNMQARTAYESLMTVTLRMPTSDEYRQFSNDVKARAADMFPNFTYGEDEVNSFVGAFHDAVLLYALALNETLAENGSISDGEAITKKMWNRTFAGITGNVSIDANGDRNADYSLMDLNPETNKFEVVANYFGNRRKYEPVKGKTIHWAGGRQGPPPDSPKCGFDGSKCPPDEPFPEYGIVIIVLGSILLIVLIAVFFIYRHIKLEAELAEMNWRVRWDDILFGAPEKNKKLERQGSRLSLRGKGSLPSDCSGDTIAVHLNASNRQLFTRTGYYKGAIIAIKPISRSNITISKPMLLEIKRMKDLQNDHIVRFIGACIDYPHHCILTEYCPKGSLQDVLENDQIKLDWMFRYSIMQDIVRGMAYLQGTEIRSHGYLKSTNCVVDSRFVVKITDFGLHHLRGSVRNSDEDENSYSYFHNKLWTAPELLRTSYRPPEGTVKGDVYSFAILCQEIVYRNGVFYLQNLDLSPQEIYQKVKMGMKPYFRPTLEEYDCPCDELAGVIRRCWSEDPADRPDFQSLKSIIRKLNRDGDKGNILDNLLSRMEQYANNLEALVEERTADYLQQKKKAEDLLYNMLPKKVASQLIRGESVTAEWYDHVSIYFSDICGFTAMSAESTPMEVVDLLNDLYTTFDSIIENFDVYKVETIGDAYMVVSGLPDCNGNLHAREIARMSLSLLKATLTFRIKHRPNDQLKLRIGIHSGPVCAGVVGLKMPRYCLFGDTVNTASRMESNGLPLKIHVSPQCKEVLESFPSFDLELRGNVEMKGKGLVKTYWLVGEKTTSDSPGATLNIL